jgi:hypothetical protein
MIRFWLGRQLIHLGLRALPQGRVRRELYRTIELWGEQVRQELTSRKPA